MQYIIEATDEVWKILSSELEPAKDDLKKVLVKSCNVLKQAAKDDKLLSDYKSFEENKNNQKHQEVVNNLEKFTEYLLQEKKLLVKYGVSEKAANALLEEAKNIHESISHWEGNAEELQKHLEVLRDEVCAAAEEITKSIGSDENKSWWKSMAKRAAKGVGGCALIATDTTVDAVATFGAASTVSVAAGGALVSNAAVG